MQDTDRLFIKIGYTVKPARERVKELQTGNPSSLRLLGSVRGSSIEEAALHERFASLRHNGEWFRPHKAIYDLIYSCK